LYSTTHLEVFMDQVLQLLQQLLHCQAALLGHVLAGLM
jgi:hypothetical protein